MVTELNYILPFIAGTYSWSYFPLFPWLAYPLLGFSFSFWEQEILHFIKKNKVFFRIILFVIAVSIVLFSSWGITKTITLQNYYHHTFLYAVWATGIVILWISIFHFFETKFSKSLVGYFLQWLGKNITLFYIIQWLIIGNIATSVYQTQSIERFVFWFPGIFAVTVLLTWLIAKTNIKLAR